MSVARIFETGAQVGHAVTQRHGDRVGSELDEQPADQIRSLRARPAAADLINSGIAVSAKWSGRVSLAEELGPVGGQGVDQRLHFRHGFGTSQKAQ